MPARTMPVTPWGKEVKKRMIDTDIQPKELVAIIRARGILITTVKLSQMLSGVTGQRSPDMVAAIEDILSIPPGIAGRPA